MKGVIASMEIFGLDGASVRRFTLSLAAPKRCEDEEGWGCRVVLADQYRPRVVTGSDSVAALTGALDQAREWVEELRKQGISLYRDRACEIPFDRI